MLNSSQNKRFTWINKGYNRKEQQQPIKRTGLMFTVLLSANATGWRVRGGGHPLLEWGHIRRMGEKEMSPWDFSALTGCSSNCTQICEVGAQTVKADIQKKQFLLLMAFVCPHQKFKSRPKLVERKKIMWRKTTFSRVKRDQTPVGARRLMKAMLLRHILLKKVGQAGFMMKCSRRIRSSVNKVRQYGFLLDV